MTANHVTGFVQPPGEGRLETELQAQIGRQLRAMYDEVVNDPVPDRFVKLLQMLDAKQAEPAADPAAGGADAPATP